MNTPQHSENSRGEKPQREKRNPPVATDFSEDDRKRFWSKVKRGNPDDCWEWTAYRKTRGYGMFFVDGRVLLAHRFSAIISGNHPTDTKPLVCHKCDNPPCCNPAHLFIGDATDNSLDMLAKGRGNKATGSRHAWVTHRESIPMGDRNGARLHPELLPRGENHGRAVLSLSQVLEIIKDNRNGKTASFLAMQFKVARTTIRKILNGDNWAEAISTFKSNQKNT